MRDVSVYIEQYPEQGNRNIVQKGMVIMIVA